MIPGDFGRFEQKGADKANKTKIGYLMPAFYMKINARPNFNNTRPAGDLTRVFVVPWKVTVKIGDAENWWRGCRAKKRLKMQKNPVRLVLSRVPFKSGV